MYPFLGINSKNILKKSCLQQCAKKWVAITAGTLLCCIYFRFKIRRTADSSFDIFLVTMVLHLLSYIELKLKKLKIIYYLGHQRFASPCRQQKKPKRAYMMMMMIVCQKLMQFKIVWTFHTELKTKLRWLTEPNIYTCGISSIFELCFYIFC